MRSLPLLVVPGVALMLVVALLVGVRSSAQPRRLPSVTLPAAYALPAALPTVPLTPVVASPAQLASLPTVEPIEEADLVALVNGAAIRQPQYQQAQLIDAVMSSLSGLQPSTPAQMVTQLVNRTLVTQQATAAGFAADTTPTQVTNLLTPLGKDETDLAAALQTYAIDRRQFDEYIDALLAADQFAHQAANQQGMEVAAYIAALRQAAHISYGPAAAGAAPALLASPSAVPTAAVVSATPVVTAAPTAVPTSAPTEEARGLGIGQLAPLFALTPLSGEGPSSSADLLGAPVVLSFWTTWCPYCLRQTPILVAGAQQFADSSVHFVGISVGEKPEAVAAYASQHAIPYPILLDSESQAAAAYAVDGYPTTYFLDADGRIVARQIGALTEDQLIQYVKQLLVPQP